MPPWCSWSGRWRSDLVVWEALSSSSCSWCSARWRPFWPLAASSSSSNAASSGVPLDCPRGPSTPRSLTCGRSTPATEPVSGPPAQWTSERHSEVTQEAEGEDGNEDQQLSDEWPDTEAFDQRW